MPPVVLGVAALGGAALAAGGIGAALAAGGLIGIAANFGASMLLSAAAQALMPQPTVAMQARTVTVREPVMPREMVYGRARKGGVIVFLHAGGDKDQYLHLVIVLAAHRVKSIGAIYFEGEEAINANGAAQGRWSGKVTVEKRLGAEDQAAFAGLVEEVSEHWTEEHRLAGCAAIYLRLTYDADAFPGGIPNITVDMEGKDDILDPRSGDQVYTENAALCVADYMAHATYGIGAGIGAEDGIDRDALVEAANICDEAVPLAVGGTEPRYNCNGVVTLSESPKTIIEAMLTAMAGRCIWQGGRWRLQAGAYRIPEIMLGADDLREGGLQLTTRLSRASNFNAVRGQFVSPENDWQPDDFPAYASDVYLTEDGGERIWRDIALPFTISAAAAQRLAKIELERARRQMSVKLDGKLSAWSVAVGETVQLDYARWGFAAKPFDVQSMRLDLVQMGDAPLLVPELVLRETSPLIYDWDASEEQIYAAAPRTNLPSPFAVAAPGRPEISEELYITRDGGGAKVLIWVTWAAAASSFVGQYQLEGQRDGGAWLDCGRTGGTMLELRDASPGHWKFRVKAISVLGVSSDWRTREAEILGLTAPPEALQNVTLQTAGGLAVLKWTRAADPDVRVAGNIVIRHSTEGIPSWANSYSMDRVAGSEAIAVVPLKPGSYLLRAEDSGGRLGPVTTISTKGAQALSFAPIDSLRADPGFPGGTTDLAVVGGTLRLATSTDEAGVPGTTTLGGLYSFGAGLDFGAVRRLRLRSQISVAALALLDQIDARTEPIDAWADFDGTEGAEIDVVVEVRETDDDPLGTPNWGPWGRVDNHEIEARAIEARAWLRTGDPAFTPVVTALRLHADEVA
ncbi:host specificity protein J, internal deletion [Roseobacter sp. MED193]|uniref:phage tail protein n=1 Tax=Roseobacter sp. MED193 TaxID=314262 RepID=UPI000068B9A8|nr:phage tail protein [Roseobacter sp. MED193]EAQ47286.1 host specificity protein J, internal deletion [Roseobacter sp. MED193]